MPHLYPGRQFVLFFVVWSISTTLAYADGKVGDMQASLLGESEFQAQHGSEWVLMDGRELQPDNPLRQKLGMDRIPDARGSYLRMRGQSAGLKSLAELDRAPGTLLGFLTAAPQENFSTIATGGHTHIISDPGHAHGTLDRKGNGSTLVDGNHQHQYNRTLLGGRYNDRGAGVKSADNDGLMDVSVTSGDSKHAHVIPNSTTGIELDVKAISRGRESALPGYHAHQIIGGDSETRPQTLLVNYFINIGIEGDRAIECPDINSVPERDIAQSYRCNLQKYTNWRSEKLLLTVSELEKVVASLKYILTKHRALLDSRERASHERLLLELESKFNRFKFFSGHE